MTSHYPPEKEVGNGRAMEDVHVIEEVAGGGGKSPAAAGVFV